MVLRYNSAALYRNIPFRSSAVSCFYCLQITTTYTLKRTMKIQLQWFALKCLRLPFLICLFVLSINSITGISTRKKTLVPLHHKKFPNLYTKQCTASTFHKNKLSSLPSLFNSNAFFDEKQIVHSSIHWGGFHTRCIFLHNTMCECTYAHTHLHTYMPVFTQNLTLVSEEKTTRIVFTHSITQVLVMAYLMPMSLKNENT
jgi:hypothetical protein